MNIYIYSDESGVFDKYHNDYFVFAGLIFLSETDSNECARRYAASEKNIRKTEKVSHNKEVKAAGIEGSSKNKLFRSLDNYEKFGIIVDQQKVEDIHSKNKRAKERYLNNLERELRQLFFNLRKIKIEYCNSKSNSLIRASDVIANRFLSATRENAYLYLKVKNLNLLRYPNIN